MLRLMLRLILRWLLLSLVLVTLGLMGGYWILNDYLDTPLFGGDEPRVIEVESGSSLTKVAYQLADQGILKWPALFTAYARLTSQTSIRVGEYPLVVGDTPRTLLERLMSGKVIYYQITFPEGLNFKEWLSLIARQPKLTQSLNELTVPVLLEQLELDIDHPEGWFSLIPTVTVPLTLVVISYCVLMHVCEKSLIMSGNLGRMVYLTSLPMKH